MTRTEIETRAIKAMENACAYEATGEIKFAIGYYFIAGEYQDILDNEFCYEIKSDHFAEMQAIMDNAFRKYKATKE